MGNLARQSVSPVPISVLDAMVRNNFACFVTKAFASVSPGDAFSNSPRAGSAWRHRSAAR